MGFQKCLAPSDSGVWREVPSNDSSSTKHLPVGTYFCYAVAEDVRLIPQ